MAGLEGDHEARTAPALTAQAVIGSYALPEQRHRMQWGNVITVAE